MSKIDLSKYAALEEAKAKRVALIAKHADELAAVEAEISREQIKLGLGPYYPEGVKKLPRVAESKRKQHEKIRDIAIQKGYIIQSGRKAGKPDLYRVRLELRAEKMGISVPTLLKRLEEERTKRALERLKPKARSK